MSAGLTSRRLVDIDRRPPAPVAQALPPTRPGEIARDFVSELYAVTEGNAPDHALLAAIPERVNLVELRR